MAKKRKVEEAEEMVLGEVTTIQSKTHLLDYFIVEIVVEQWY